MAKAMATKGGRGITAKQRAARKRNMAIARASRASGKKKKAQWKANATAATKRSNVRTHRRATRRMNAVLDAMASAR